MREHQANGMGGLPLVGDPDMVARDLAQLATAGLTGIAVSFVNYLDELPYFCAEVLPRLTQAVCGKGPGRSELSRSHSFVAGPDPATHEAQASRS
jgi:hypothetical protein